MDELEKISVYAGMREDLVQAGGGNTSVKIFDERMYIKASGCQLADVSMKRGYAVVNPKKIVDFFQNTPISRIKREQEKEILDMAFIEGERPSIETFLHSITDKVTMHTHPLPVNVLASRKHGMEELKKLFPDALFVPYATPGINLAKEYFKAWQENDEKTSKVIFLKNHGLIVSGKTAGEVINKNEDIMEILAGYLDMDYSGYQNATKLYNILLEMSDGGNIVYLAQNRYIYEAFERLGYVWHHEICPDCIVYCGKKILELNKNFDKSDIEEHILAYGWPVVIRYQNNFYIVAQSMRKAKEIESILAFSAQTALANAEKSVDLLSDEEQNFLLNWEAEKFRRNMK